MNININSKIYQACPELIISVIECNVVNTLFNSELWLDIESFCADFKVVTKMEDINKRATIFATREAYKKCGKDPNRYRPSAEAF